MHTLLSMHIFRNIALVVIKNLNRKLLLFISPLARTCSPCVTWTNRAIILVLQTMHGIGIPRKQEKLSDY